MTVPAQDLRVRLAAFERLQSQVDFHGEVLPRSVLETGFDFEGEKVRLVGPQGIFKPKQISTVPLFITTAPKGPYSDHF
jgi:putative restriction endonuclease